MAEPLAWRTVGEDGAVRPSAAFRGHATARKGVLQSGAGAKYREKCRMRTHLLIEWIAGRGGGEIDDQ